jgi:hemolysin activation/secretion protein
VPDNRQFNYPWLEYQYIDDGFIEAYNIQQINRVEDINLGAQARFRLGYSSSIYPENDGAYVFNGDYSRGFSLSENQLLLADVSADGLYGDAGLYNTVVKGSLSYHWKNFDRGQLYVELTRAQGFHLCADQPLDLGGDTGLRGYPARYQAGDRMQLFSIEQRFFGEREWFSLFHVGAAIFYDEGRAWGESAVHQSQQGRLRDVGIGLRISGTRTGSSEAGAHNVLHLDLASPLDGGQDISKFQWLIKVKKSF